MDDVEPPSPRRAGSDAGVVVEEVSVVDTDTAAAADAPVEGGGGGDFDDDVPVPTVLPTPPPPRPSVSVAGAGVAAAAAPRPPPPRPVPPPAAGGVAKSPPPPPIQRPPSASVTPPARPPPRPSGVVIPGAAAAGGAAPPARPPPVVGSKPVGLALARMGGSTVNLASPTHGSGDSTPKSPVGTPVSPSARPSIVPPPRPQPPRPVATAGLSAAAAGAATTPTSAKGPAAPPPKPSMFAAVNVVNAPAPPPAALRSPPPRPALAPVAAAPAPAPSAPAAAPAPPVTTGDDEEDDFEAAINSRNAAAAAKAPKPAGEEEEGEVVQVESVQLPAQTAVSPRFGPASPTAAAAAAAASSSGGSGGRSDFAGTSGGFVTHGFVDVAHQFPLVDKQVRGGHENLRKTALWLRQVFAATKQTADAALKCVTAEEGKLEAEGDAMYEHVGSLRLVQTVMIEHFKHTSAWCSKAEAQVVKPLETAHSLGEQARVKLSRDDKEQNTAMGAKSVEVEKHKVACLKLWADLMELKKEKKEEDSKPAAKVKAGAKEKILEKIRKLKDKARKAWAQFEELQTKHLESQAEYRNRTLPQRLRLLEVLEVDRLDAVKKILDQFCALLKEHALPLPLTASLQKQVAGLSTQRSLQTCITQWIRNLGDCPAYVPAPFHLPCTVAELDDKSDGWMNPAPRAGVNNHSADEETGGGGGDGDGDDEDDDGMDDPTLADSKQDNWLRAKVDYDGTRMEGHISFRADDIVCVTDATGPMMVHGYVVGGSNPKHGLLPKLALEPLIAGKKDDDQPAEGAAEGKSLLNSIRSKVSKKKRRYLRDGYDLDLSYITPNILGMGFPSEGLAGQYRNNMSDVQRFMNTKHAGKYRIYNLCSEREYDSAKFGGRCARFPFDDHNPCPLSMIEPFCVDMHKHLESAPDALAAVHCKAGKGRTGFMIACYLLHSGFSPSANHALRYYAAKRTYNCKGVTIPSQIRYTHYYEQLLALKRDGRPSPPPKNPLILSLLTIHGIPAAVRDEGVAVWFVVEFPGTKLPKYSSKGVLKAERRPAQDHLFFQGHSVTGITPVSDDIKISVYHGTLLSQQQMFHFWFNTRMIKGAGGAGAAAGAGAGAGAGGGEDDRDGPTAVGTKSKLVLKKYELDKAVKDKNHKLYSPSMRVELLFTSV